MSDWQKISFFSYLKWALPVNKMTHNEIKSFLDKYSYFLPSAFSRDMYQNLHWKLGWLTPSFGSILAVWLKNYFFLRIKLFLFFKIESWNFQHLFEIAFCGTSPFNSFSFFSMLLFSFFLSVVWLSWNVRFDEILFQTVSESFSFLSWKTKKFYS